MARLIAELDSPSKEPGFIKAGIGHLWFVMLHPFDDGNGRIGRAIGARGLLRKSEAGGRSTGYELADSIER